VFADLGARSAPDPSGSVIVVERHPLVGQPAPEFTLQGFDGRALSLADYRGRPLLINFWASYCGPCRIEFPLFKQARDRYAAQGLEILGVVFHDDREDAARAFHREQAATWPAMYDPANAVGQSYRVLALPTTFYVDRSGVVRRVSFGPPPSGTLDQHLAEIIGSPAG
jgi:cytochrome c biogenesis protein CcmG, thiol:disulfide interchange protein DsbE